MMKKLSEEFYYVSVIIPSYNGGELLIEVVKKLLEQKFEKSYSITLIDSSSTDGSIELIKELTYTVNNFFIMKIPKREFGHGKTRNFAASLTNSKYIVFLTQDALPASKKLLNELIKPLEKNSSVAGAFGRHIPYDNAPILVKKFVSGLMTKYGFSNLFEIDDKLKYLNDSEYRQNLYFFSDNCSILRRDIWEKYPFEDVDYGEDQIWARTILEAGYKKAYAESAIVYHSHDYGIYETFDRAVVDRKFWIEHFNIPTIQSINEVITSSWEQTVKDFQWLKENSIDLSFNNKLNIALKNIARFLGEYYAYKKK